MFSKKMEQVTSPSSNEFVLMGENTSKNLTIPKLIENMHTVDKPRPQTSKFKVKNGKLLLS